MRLIIFSFSLFVVSAAICNAPQASEYEIFAQKYEITFGEKPSDQVWNLGKESCDTCGNCRACGALG